MFIPYYISWHYGYAFAALFKIWMNFLWFTYHFFSLPLLVMTLFSPWRRLHDTYKGGLNFGDLIASLFVNFLMRIIGAGLRTFIIVIGFLALFAVFLLGVLSFIVWIAMPIILITLLTMGLGYLF